MRDQQTTNLYVITSYQTIKEVNSTNKNQLEKVLKIYTINIISSV